MIDPDVVARVRNGICAVGYLTVPLDTYSADATEPFFKVVGTGFLVRSTTAITNRHVIEGLIERQADLGFPDAQRMLLFVVPDEQVGLSPVVRMIRGMAATSDPALDVGFVDFQRQPEAHFTNIEALSLQEHWDSKVTEEIAVCGYPYGEAMLQRSGRVYRWGPVVQQGYVSALSPFDHLPERSIPNEVLLDVRIAGGMSGAPIFRPCDGIVTGIVHSTWEATTALGLPLTRSAVEAWLSDYDGMKT
jgi:hypothetical protein